MDRWDEAIACFDHALEIDQGDEHALEWKVTALRKGDRYPEAEAYAAEAIQRLPRCPGLHVEYAWALSDQDREDEAATRAERALAIDPATPGRSEAASTS